MTARILLTLAVITAAAPILLLITAGVLTLTGVIVW